MEFQDLKRIYNPEREALCVDEEGVIVANHTIGFLCTRPVTDYGTVKVREHKDRGCDIWVKIG